VDDPRLLTESPKITVTVHDVEVLVPLAPARLMAQDLAVGSPVIGTASLQTAFARPKVIGKRWIEVAYDLKRDKFRTEGTSITDAARELAKDSETAEDCAKPVKWTYVKNELRKGLWHKPPRNRFKQQPK
jgi:hypothetical protein